MDVSGRPRGAGAPDPVTSYETEPDPATPAGLRPAEGAPASLAPRVLLEAGLADGAAVVDGPLGPTWVACGPHGVSGVDLVAEVGFDELADRHERRTGRRLYPIERLPDGLAPEVARALRTGRLGAVPVDLDSLTEFQQQVLRTTAAIPPGETRSYGWVAAAVGRPGATRAVGSALARNPVPLLVPCHRVVQAGGALGNYSLGGPANKRRLLELEGALAG